MESRSDSKETTSNWRKNLAEVLLVASYISSFISSLNFVVYSKYYPNLSYVDYSFLYMVLIGFLFAILYVFVRKEQVTLDEIVLYIAIITTMFGLMLLTYSVATFIVRSLGVENLREGVNYTYLIDDFSTWVVGLSLTFFGGVVAGGIRNRLKS